MAFENFLDKVSELAQTGVAKSKELIDVGGAKAKELTEIGKLKVENATEQEAIKKAYIELGKLYFAEHGAAPEEPYAALCEKIVASKAKIEYNLERIADIKAASGLKDEEVFEEPVVEEPFVEAEAEVEDAPVDAPEDDKPAE